MKLIFRFILVSAFALGAASLVFAGALPAKVLTEMQANCRTVPSALQEIQKLELEFSDCEKKLYRVEQASQSPEYFDFVREMLLDPVIELRQLSFSHFAKLEALRTQYELFQPVCNQILALKSADSNDQAIVNYHTTNRKILRLGIKEDRIRTRLNRNYQFAMNLVVASDATVEYMRHRAALDRHEASTRNNIQIKLGQLDPIPEESSESLGSGEVEPREDIE